MPGKYPAKEFLLNPPTTINKSGVAFAMYPHNKTAPAHLQKKLTDVRTWNDEDEKAARSVLKDLCMRIEGLDKPI